MRPSPETRPIYSRVGQKSHYLVSPFWSPIPAAPVKTNICPLKHNAVAIALFEVVSSWDALRSISSGTLTPVRLLSSTN